MTGVLKHSIGKDLTKISFPVFFNEPTSMLQRMAEDMEFSECCKCTISRSRCRTLTEGLQWTRLPKSQTNSAVLRLSLRSPCPTTRRLSAALLSRLIPCLYARFCQRVISLLNLPFDRARRSSMYLTRRSTATSRSRSRTTHPSRLATPSPHVGITLAKLMRRTSSWARASRSGLLASLMLSCCYPRNGPRTIRGSKARSLASSLVSSSTIVGRRSRQTYLVSCLDRPPSITVRCLSILLQTSD